jgi:hypothetical protein
MDKITQGLLAEFTKQFDLGGVEESERFETFATFLATRRHYSEASFDPPDLVIGSGGDTGIDGIAIIVNNTLVSDVDTVADLADINGYLEVAFIFVQAERSEGFDGGKIGTFGAGVQDFFGKGKLDRNDNINTPSKSWMRFMNVLASLGGTQLATCIMSRQANGRETRILLHEQARK